MTGNALITVDEILVPMHTEHFALRGLVNSMLSRTFASAELPGLAVRRILATMVDARTTLASEFMQEIRRFYQPRGNGAFEPVLPRRMRFAAEPDSERSSAAHRKHCNCTHGTTHLDGFAIN